MKTIAKIIIHFGIKTLSVFLLLLPFLVAGQGKNNVWDYPIKPGTEEWKQLKNNVQKVAACQVPDTIIFKLTTSDLLKICLNYPLLPDVFAFNNINDGFFKYQRDFNGFPELLKRKDVGTEIITLYSKADPEYFRTTKTLMGKGNAVIYISELELFISHSLIIEKFTNEEKKDVLSELLRKKNIKIKYPSWYQFLGIQTCYLAIYNILEPTNEIRESGTEPSALFPLIYFGIPISETYIDKLDVFVNGYINTIKP